MNAEGWVLAGGRSLRMGGDKAAIALASRPLLEHMLDKLRSLGLRVRVSGLRQPAMDVLPRTALAETVQDAHPDCGPLSGLETALANSDPACVLALAVDLPLVSTSFLAWMLGRAQCTGSFATVPCVGGEPQPLCAVYRQEMLASVREALEEGDYKMMHAIERCGMRGEVDQFDVETLMATGGWGSGLPAHLQFMNCNTPDDLEAAEAVLTTSPML